MSAPIVFTPVESVTVQTSCSPVPETFAMPANDGETQAFQVTADGATTAYVSFAPGAAVGPDAHGCLVVKPGQSALLTQHAPALTAAAQSGRVLAQCVGGSPTDRYGIGALPLGQAMAAATATQCTILTIPAGGIVTIANGYVAPQTHF